MAVVYADLRFSRPTVPPQRDATLVSTSEDWEITYENVTPARSKEAPERRSAAGTGEERGFLARHSRYLIITAGFLLLGSLIAVTTLSARLSQVTHQHQETSIRLEKLQEEHEHLNSSLTHSILSKDSAARRLQEDLQKRQSELKNTQNDLRRSQEEKATINTKLQRTIQEKSEGESNLSRVRGELWNTQNSLQVKQTELNSCQDYLSMQRRKYNSDTSQLQSAKAKVSQDLKLKESSLTLTRQELTDTKGALQRVQKQLKDIQMDLEHGKKTLSEREQKLRDVDQCFQQSCSEELEHDGPDSDVETVCPRDWRRIGESCYYFSTETSARIMVEKHCTSRAATLAVVSEEDSTLKNVIRKYGKSFWIGLSKNDKDWQWADGTKHKDFNFRGYSSCAVASPALLQQSCSTKLPWICQKRTQRCRLKMAILRCIGEKIGLFGEIAPGDLM